MAHQPNSQSEVQESKGSSHENEAPKSGVLFFVDVDGASISFDHRFVTGRDVLNAAHKVPPDSFDLYEKSKGGGRKLVGLDEKIDLLEGGIEKFRTIPKTRTDGRDNSTLAPLIDEDVEFLESTGYVWSVENWQGNRVVVIRDYRLPDGYGRTTIDIAVVLPLTYPSAQLDMFYFFPGLSRLDGKPINATADQDFNGRIWQRWSRHRTNESAWRTGIDNLETHLCLMDACLRDELGR